MKLTDSEKEMFKDLAEQFSDELSNNGCNDYFLKDYIEDINERRQLLLDFVNENYVKNPTCDDANNERLEIMEDEECDNTADFVVWEHLVKKILND